MIFPRTPKPAPDPQGGPESRLPGERSGQGSRDLFKLIERDIRRKAGLPPKQKPDDKR
jgi:hypothetical protein